MDNIGFLVWLFPALFIFHDFEEIIFIHPWLNKRRKDISEKFPKAKKILSHQSGVTTSSFALAVFEEFIIACIVTITAYFTNWYYLWLGAFIAYILHLLMHCIQALYIRQYVPALITSIICLPISIYVLGAVLYVIRWELSALIIWTIIGVGVMVINLNLIHKGMKYFDKLIS